MFVGALLGAMAVGQALAVNLRYQLSGDYFDTTNSTAGVNGWQAGGSGAGGLPGLADTMRLNWGGAVGNLVTLSAPAPTVGSFQLGVNESGHLVINAGGILNTTNSSTVGNNPSAAVFGRVTVNAGGEMNVTNVLHVGASATGIITNNGGTVRCTSHLWVGSASVGVGSIYITNGGVFTVGANIGLGTINASTPSGGKGSIYVQDGGVLNLSNISPTNSIQPGSLLDISGSGLVIVNNDRTAVMSYYTNVGRITAYGGLGTVGIDYNNTNTGKTTLFAIAPLVGPPTNAVWNPALNVGDTDGLWNVSTNWDVAAVPASVTKVQFRVDGAIPCLVTNAAVAKQIVIGDGGPGGALILTNGGSLTTGADVWSAVGYNSNALMIVASGSSASFGYHLWVGHLIDGAGTLVINGGTVSVGAAFGLGTQGGTGQVIVTNGGLLNLAQWAPFGTIIGSSLLDVSGTGKVVVNGNKTNDVGFDVSSGKITAAGGSGTVALDYNNIYAGKTTIYAEGAQFTPQQTVWNPALNLGDTDGLWNVSSNWNGGFAPGSGTTVKFNVLDAIPCTVTNAAAAGRVVMGESAGPGGTLILTNGGSLTVGSGDWSAIGYSSNAVMRVESGCSASFGYHLWIGFNPGAEGTLIINGGTVSVGGAFGLGNSGGQGLAQVNEGSTLNLAQLGADKILGTSVLDIAGTGKVFINGNQTVTVSNYVSSGRITANGGSTVYYRYDSGTGKTTVSATPLALPPPPSQTITGVSVSGSEVSLTYQTTAGYTYYIEGTPSLSPAAWTPVVGSTNTATGAPVTFTFPASPGPMFYRTVSP